MASWRTAHILALLVLQSAAFGQAYDLSESPRPGEAFRVTISSRLTGALKVTHEGKETSVPLTVRSEHAYLEKVLKSDRGIVQKSARSYEKAVSGGEIGDEKMHRTVRDERRLIVAQRAGDSLFCYSPAGPLTRDELDVVSQHFDSLHLTGLLPGKEVAIGDKWAIGNAAAQGLCLFEGLLGHELTGKLSDVKDGQAIITIEGKASGIELGAMVKVDVTATARYDLLKHRLVAVEWKQKDTRDLGPASPASEMESTTTVARTLLEEEPKELSATALVGVPADDEPQELLKLVHHRDHRDRYMFLHSRDWHVVGQTEHHLVLRLLDRGDFIAQVTIAAVGKEKPGQHMSAEDFRRMAGEGANWQIEEVMESGEVPTDEGRYMYRIAAKGDLDGTKVVQSFVLLAGPQGDQVVVTFTMKPANAGKIGTKDLALVNAIEFIGKK